MEPIRSAISGDPKNVYLKLGYKRGNHAFGIDWGETTDLGPGDASSYSVAWVGQMLQGVELYATYRVESLDKVPDAEDIKARVEVATRTTMAKAQGQELSEEDPEEMIRMAKQMSLDARNQNDDSETFADDDGNSK